MEAARPVTWTSQKTLYIARLSSRPLSETQVSGVWVPPGDTGVAGVSTLVYTFGERAG